jgi:hypothetical protein
MEKKFSYVIIITAIIISASSAYYSVFGLSKLFSGAKNAVIVLASSLEFGKVITAILLHLFWDKLSTLKRYYLFSATIILVLITSLGILGFLLSAYKEVSSKDILLTKKIEILKYKKKQFEDRVKDLESEKVSIISNISDLRSYLTSDNQTQTIDKRTGLVLTSKISTSKKNIEVQIDEAIRRRDRVEMIINSNNDSIVLLETKIIETEASSSTTSELGPLKFMSDITGYPMDNVIFVFILLIVFVFDPFAIMLMITGTKFLSHQDDKKSFEKENHIESNPENITSENIKNNEHINNDVVIDENNEQLEKQEDKPKNQSKWSEKKNQIDQPTQYTDIDNSKKK